MFRPLWELGHNLYSGSRFAFFCHTRPWHFHGSFLQVVLLVAVSVLLPFIYDYLVTAPENRFNLFAISYQACLYLAFFVSVVVIARIQNNYTNLTKVLVMFLSVTPVIWLLYSLLDWLVQRQSLLDDQAVGWGVFAIYVLWYLSIIFRALGRLYHISSARRFVLIGLYAAFNFVPLFSLPNQPLWYRVDFNLSKASAGPEVNIENTYYQQDILLDYHLRPLLSHRPVKTDLFFLGLAGYADEDVFMNEVIYARNLMDNQFDTNGRSAVLINNKKTIESFPLANKHNLEKSLLMISRKMDVDQDVLFLFISSHGSEDHKLAMQLDPLELNDVRPEEIRSALDSAGIKWRVIMVSACYSGGFIEPLQDEHTLVMTAAKHDRHSFGCGHNGPFTYFGKAYFDESLRQANSFIEAFNLAKEVIAQREQQSGQRASLPQIHVGNKIKAKLEELNDSRDDT